jgi:hypothetical protein
MYGNGFLKEKKQAIQINFKMHTPEKVILISKTQKYTTE